MKARLVFILSLSLNLALAGWVAWRLERPWVDAVAEEPSVAPAADTARALAASPRVDAIGETITYLTNRLRWREIETNDLTQLVMNLRAVGCPEQTVRDLVRARARRVLERIALAADPAVPFWTAGARRARAQREFEDRAWQAEDQLVARLQSVLGTDFVVVPPISFSDFEEEALMRFALGPLPEDSFQKAIGLFAHYDGRRERISDRAGGLWLEEDETALRELAQACRRELNAVLTEAQYEEMSARLIMIAELGEVKFECTDLRPAEIRHLALLRARLAEPLAPDLFRHGALTEEQEEGLKAATRQFLGERRFAELERASDFNFCALYDLGQEQQLPRTAAEQVYALRQLTCDEITRLRENQSLSAAERRQRLSQVLAEAQQAALQVLGATACGQYLNRGGQWLTNVSGL